MNYELLSAILDSLADPVVFCDNDHIVRYINKKALTHYDEGLTLLGSNIMDCHNEESNRMIEEIHGKMFNGLDEEKITDNEKLRIYMRAVRDAEGKLLGYYERYEKKEPGV